MERSLKRIEFKPTRQFTPGVVCSLVLAVVMLAVFSAAAAGLSRLSRMVAAESRAVLVSEITVARLRALPKFTSVAARKIFLEEFAAAGFDSNVRAETVPDTAGNLELIVIYDAAAFPSRPLSKVKIPCRPR